jgi:uncharacterized membrane protein
MNPLATVARGEDSRIAEARRAVVRTTEEWTALWAAHAGPGAPAPSIDFSSSMVAAAFAGAKPAAGYAIEITSAVEEGEGVRLCVEERSPARGMATAQILTSPYHVVSLPRVNGEVGWSSGASRLAHPTSPIDAPSSTGLKPRTAAALAYLAGPVSGVTILLAETRNDFVRFHAWQAILGIGGAGLVVIACYVLAFGSLFVSATGVATLVRVATALWLALVALWAICVWQAWFGRTWKLPLVGKAATRLAIHSQLHNSATPNSTTPNAQPG